MKGQLKYRSTNNRHRLAGRKLQKFVIPNSNCDWFFWLLFCFSFAFASQRGQVQLISIIKYFISFDLIRIVCLARCVVVDGFLSTARSCIYDRIDFLVLFSNLRVFYRCSKAKMPTIMTTTITMTKIKTILIRSILITKMIRVQKNKRNRQKVIITHCTHCFIQYQIAIGKETSKKNEGGETKIGDVQLKNSTRIYFCLFQ